MNPNLARLRAEQVKFMDLTCTRRRITKTPDGKGGFTLTNTDVANIACNVGSVSRESELIIAGRLTDKATFYVTLPYGTSVQNGDQIIVGSEKFKVIYVAPVDSFSTAIRCLVVNDD